MPAGTHHRFRSEGGHSPPYTLTPSTRILTFFWQVCQWQVRVVGGKWVRRQPPFTCHLPLALAPPRYRSAAAVPRWSVTIATANIQQVTAPVGIAVRGREWRVQFVPFSPSFVLLERDDFCSPQAGPLSLECGGLTPLWLCLSFSPLLQRLSCKKQS